MQIFITGRNLELTDDIRNYVEKKVGKAEIFLDGIIEANVVLDVQGHRHIAEVTLVARRVTFHAQSETGNVFASIDDVVDKIDIQTRRYNERIKDRRHRASQLDAALQLSEMGEIAEVDVSDDEEGDVPRLVKVSEKFAPKPMTAEEAAMQLKLSQDDFLMFLNPETDQINVVYRRRSGDYGWIEPEFS
ncbi:TPA: ribosome-associated translation inhibitor RaiA [Candidatus Poribacteria bacterium]|nr:ribosome-associated translation inhibitor RaiA [Candidatus Poribacteria bacterium]